jgi:PASTA domain-containing protein
MKALRLGTVISALVAALVCVPGALSVPPSNDDFLNAETISGEAGSIDGSTDSATHELGEPYHAGEPGTGSVWYLWTAPSDKTIRFDTCSTPGFDTLVGVYTGVAVDALSPVGAADDNCDAGGGGFVEFVATPGTTYWIAVDRFDTTGPFKLEWAVPRPRNEQRPSFLGPAIEGAALEVSPGVWRYAESFSYHWRSCPPSETTVTIRCARLQDGNRIINPNEPRITVPVGIVGQKIGVSVSGIGPGGESLLVNVLSEPVVYAVPANKVLPLLEPWASVNVGQTLSSGEGTWELGSAPRLDLTYLWERCDRAVVHCQTVKGAGRDNSYVPTSADLGFRIRSVVTITSAGGTASAASPPAEVVPVPTPRVRTCRVPRLLGKTTRTARRLLSRSACKFRLGLGRRVYSARSAGLIVRQSPKAGTRLRAGGKVSVFVSKGRRR